MSEWAKTRLGDVISTNTTSYSTKEGWEFVNYLDTGNITENVVAEIQRIDLNTEKLPSRAKRKVQHNSLLYSTVRPNQRHYGIVKEQPDNFLVSTGFTVIDVDESKVDADFLFFLLTQDSLVELLHSIAEQSVSAYPSIKALDIENLEVELPPLIEQKKIASILNTISDKMRQNTEVNKNLQEQAQTIYMDMFITNADPTWPVGHLSDLISVRYGKDHKKLADGAYPVYGSGGIMRYVERPLYDKESVLIPRKGTLNNVMYVNEPFWSVDTMFFTKMKQDNIAKFVFHFVKSKDLASLNAGSAVPSMTTDILNAMELYIPDKSSLKKFEDIVAPMYLSIQHNEQENAELASLRDILLPRLMSGELDVSDLDL